MAKKKPDIEFRWEIRRLQMSEAPGEPEGSVGMVYWSLSGTNAAERVTCEIGAASQLESPGNGADFIAYEDLTPETVLAWLEAHPDAAKYKAEVAGSVAQAIAAKGVDPERLPWANGGGG